MPTAASSPLHHLAIIMDGNGRWAEKNNLPRLVGHGAGGVALTNLIVHMLDQPNPIPLVTLYAFSTENWHRPDSEIASLFKYSITTLTAMRTQACYRKIRVRIIGDRNALPAAMQKSVRKTEQATARNDWRITFNIAFNYSGRWDILNACREVAREVRDDQLSPGSITEADVKRHLSMNDDPDPDLLIRTGGEKRISNFLLWQMAYTEMYFEDCLWPDFTGRHLDKALQWYHRRERRFGALTDQPPVGEATTPAADNPAIDMDAINKVLDQSTIDEAATSGNEDDNGQGR